MDFSEKYNKKIFYMTPVWRKDQVVKYLEELGYKREDILNPLLYRHFQAFYNYCRRSR